MRSIRSRSSLVLRPSQLRHQHNGAFLQGGHQLGQLRPIGPDAANFLAVDGLGAGSLQGLELTGEVLVLGRHAGISR
jgi:hypothetical protein